MNFIKVQIGGKERFVRFGLKVIGDCISHYDNDPTNFLKALTSNSFESAPLLFFYGIKYDVERTGGSIDFTLYDVYDWVEELGLNSDEVSNVIKRFIRSLYDNVPAIKEVIDGQEEEVKKNLIGIET